MNIDELKNKVKEILSSKPVLSAFLFGSFLHLSFEKANDIDIIINLDNNSNFSLIDLSRMQIDLTEKLNKKVDLLTEESISPFILPGILAERILIYEKQ